MISATSYTVVGVINKFLTVLLNVLVWDKHSTPTGITSVCLCLMAGVFYEQSPRRSEVSSNSNSNDASKITTTETSTNNSVLRKMADESNDKELQSLLKMVDGDDA